LFIEQFLEALEEFSKVAEENVTEQAKDIFDKFFQEGAPLPLNVDDSTQQEIRKRVESNELTRNLFDTAKEEVINLVNNDSFLRFSLDMKKRAKRQIS
jgi:hypothetical protein